MKLNLLMSFFAFTLFTGFSPSVDEVVEGEKFPSSVTYDGQTLVFNGGGLREKYWIDLYVAGLYLKTKSKSVTDIYDEKKSVALKIKLVSSLVDRETFIESADAGFEKSTNNNTSPWKSQIAKLKSALSEEFAVGDVIDFVYLPGTGIDIYKNGEKKININKVGFKKVFYGIWFCDNPVDVDLKNGLLGK